MSQAAADIVLAELAKKPKMVLGLPTGTTPIGMYDALAKAHKEDKVDFSGVTTFNLDEYVGLAPDHEQSYWYFMNKYLYSRTNLKRENVHVPNGAAQDLDARFAREYDEMIKNSGGIDLFVVGIGQNGHIAFNEPAAEMPAFTHVVELTQNTINANARLFDDISQVPRKALTQGMATIMHAKKILLLAGGPAKRDAIKRMTSGVLTLDCPASLLNLHPDVTILDC
ncbi:glucosamine-6-phosphate isomerase [Holotrichia oblita]|nr:glucosamine-6-phosphate isomerase [Holotrichia oblita]